MAEDTDDNVMVQVNQAGDTADVVTDYITPDGYSNAGHVQAMKLISGVNGETAPVGADTDTTSKRGLFVESHLRMVRLAASVAGASTGTAYTAGDQVGSEFSLASAVRYSGGTGRILGVSLVDKSDVIGAYDIIFTKSSITLAGDNSAWAISDTHAQEIIELISLGGAVDIGNNRFSRAMGLAIPFKCDATTLYASLITREGHAAFGASTDLYLQVYVDQD